MISVILGLTGLAIVLLVMYEAKTYWQQVYYVRLKDYLMMIYYGIIGLYGIVCICC